MQLLAQESPRDHAALLVGMMHLLIAPISKGRAFLGFVAVERLLVRAKVFMQLQPTIAYPWERAYVQSLK
jgi:hypothetical protein